MTGLDKEFTAVLQKSPSKGGWTYVSFATKGLVKVRGTIDGRTTRTLSLVKGAAARGRQPASPVPVIGQTND